MDNDDVFSYEWLDTQSNTLMSIFATGLTESREKAKIVSLVYLKSRIRDENLSWSFEQEVGYIV